MVKIVASVLVFLFFLMPSLFAQTSPSSNAADSAEIQRMMQAASASGGAHNSNPYARPRMAMPLITKEKIQKIMQSVIEMALIYKMVDQPSMVSTADGGVIVAYGGTLRKYDKDLNAVKEVDLDVDVDSMESMAAKFSKKYSDEMMDVMNPGTESASSASATSQGYDPQKEAQIQKEIAQMK